MVASFQAPSGLKRAGLAGGATLSGAALGLASATSLLPALATGALAGFIWLSVVSVPSALFGFLFVRSISDAFAAVPIVGAFNAGALLGMLAIVLAVVRLATMPRPRGVAVAAVVMLGLIANLAVGMILFGFRMEIVEELIRSASILAVALIAANPRGEMTPSRLGTAVLLASVLPAILVVGDGAMRWQELVAGYRPKGTLSHPNTAAMLFAMMLALALWKWFYDGRRVWHLVVAALMLLGVILTQSMGGLVQLGATVGTLGMFQYRGVGVRLAAAAMLAILAVFFLLDPFGISRVDEITSAPRASFADEAQASSWEWRLLNWGLLLEEWKKEPVFGYGLGATTDMVRPLNGPYNNGLPHSDYVRLLVETGVVGFVVVGAACIWLSLWFLRRALHGPHEAFMAAVLASLLGVLAHGWAHHASLTTGGMYVLAALIGGAFALIPREERPRVRFETSPAAAIPTRGAVVPSLGRGGLARDR
jgi:O-antigen ligase